MLADLGMTPLRELLWDWTGFLDYLVDRNPHKARKVYTWNAYSDSFD